jgi:hypothetical protein
MTPEFAQEVYSVLEYPDETLARIRESDEFRGLGVDDRDRRIIEAVSNTIGLYRQDLRNTILQAVR